MGFVGSLVAQALSLLATLFVFAVGLFVLAVIVMFIIDISQREDAIRRNYPVIGRFRHLFSTLGEFFRQYFFAQDREEMPFNRAQREWAYKSAAGVDNTVAFGSTQNITAVGSPIYANGIYAPLDDEVSDPPALIIGEGAREPYRAASLINVSAMSYGSLSAPAVRALSAGAKMEHIKLKNKNIHPCTGCYTCWTKTPGECIFDDDMTDLRYKFRTADLIIFASPLYVYSVTGIMKNFLDRLVPNLMPL